jgi:hypothetical protein
MDNTISTKMKTDAMHALKENTANRLREERALDKAPNCIQLILDHALYFPEEGGIVIFAALVNPTEQAEQVTGATIKIPDPDGEFPAISMPSAIAVPEIPVWCSAFPVRIAADEALIGQMFFQTDDGKSLVDWQEAVKRHGPFRAIVHFVTLKSGTLTRECRVMDVRHYRSIG